ncbi:putative fha domain protein [Daldinia childiae]|uniref:putative fha domain protein n=1 Tax=Daldinia childiae TaxID=326645 RepID=UPI0014466C79|nr:putative fha domain protein [Daldinia childiae]KAF3058500.1 putative fha domain protein [Daldinia childiae]
MAATGHFSRNDDEVIIVTLVCRPHDSQISAFPKRQFILSNENPSIRIGRASKVPTKGFVASIDNAWFDSPVMSRNHAELVLDLDSIPKSVVIKDIGSLHGTFHIPHDGVGKEMRLEQQRPVRLSNGDSLRFGTDIFRAKETFPPYSVEFYMVGQEHEPCSQDVPTTNQSPNRTFTIPDDDLDDEDDDDESVVETCMPPSRNTNIQRGLSIDLTQDEDDSDEDQHVASNATAPNHFNSDVIDLTSEPDEHSDHEIHDRCPSHSSASATIDVPSIPALVTAFASYNHELLAGMEQSEKHTALDVEPDASSEHDYSFPHDEDMGSEDIHLTDSEDGSILIRGDDMSSMDEDSDDDDSPASMFNDDVVRSDSWGSDNESILPYSESDDDSSSSDDEMMDPLSNSSSRAPNTFAESTNTEDVFVAPFLFTTSTQQGASVVQPREPSPSDAAMFKSHPVLDRTASISRAQALGEKSGKHAFFAARESNRMNLDWNSPPPVSAIRETLAADADTDQHITDVESDHASHTALPVPWSVSGERFLNHPRIEELPSNPERPQSPDFDMTSAYTFQLSKIASETSAASLASKPRRVEIQDLLTQEPNGDNNTNDDPITPHIFSTASSAPLPTSECVPEPNLKRSFDDAFSNDEDVIGLNEECISREDDKSKSMSSNRRTRNDEVTNVESNEATAPETPEQDSIEAQPAIIPARRDNVQPSKRRRFAQAAAYVALGGAAAFTYMVSTAPVL